MFATFLWMSWLVLTAFSIGILVTNFYLIAAACITRRRQPALIPLLGGLLGALAIAISPVWSINALWWIPLLADPAGIPFMVKEIYLALRFIRRA